MPQDTLGIGLVGTGFVTDIHATAFERVTGAEVRAVVSRDPERAREFSRKHSIPRHYTDYGALLADDSVDIVTLGVPNDLHCELTVEAARAGKHVIIEKPLCRNLAEADRMLAAGKEHGVHLFYAEELCFTPKYVRAKNLVDSGALGEIYLIKQAERHDGPHSDWFWDVERSGGGATLDLGCHAIEFFRWILGKPRIVSVYAQMGTHVHGERTRGDDNALVILEFEGGAIGLAEEGWSKPGGMDDRVEVYGSRGQTYADLLRGNSLLTYSASGYDYAVEKAGSTEGWSFTMYEEIWNYGFPQEMQHFVDVVRRGDAPLETARDGRAVLEAIFAAYASAGTGKKVALPFETDADKPIDLWRGGAADRHSRR